MGIEVVTATYILAPTIIFKAFRSVTVFLIPPAKILAEFLKRRYLTIAPSSKPNMSAHSFFRPHRRIRKSTPPRTPSEPLGSTLPSTPTSVSTPTDILVLDDGASTPTIADERQIPTSSQC
ncbi:hypothetical protein HZ326_29884, partial [Fusarium oxysporum f. sp. albedinis]